MEVWAVTLGMPANVIGQWRLGAPGVLMWGDDKALGIPAKPLQKSSYPASFKLQGAEVIINDTGMKSFAKKLTGAAGASGHAQDRDGWEV